MKFLAALLPMLLTFAGRILTALGITAITYVGFDIIINQLKAYMTQSLSGVSAGALQLFYISGGGVILNIFFGMLTFIVTFKSMTKLSSALGKK